jgi:hypothetical protein
MVITRILFSYLLLWLSAATTAFNLPINPSPRSTNTVDGGTTATNNSRRQFLIGSVGNAVSALVTTVILSNQPAHAIPMITTDEFRIILRDSAQAINVVEFSGPKSEIVTAKLVDGTSFGISDVVESSVDPRSPLKIAAMCRENLVKTKFTTLEAALAGAPKKKKIYANERVQIAAEKEKARKERIENDEAERLAQLYTYEKEQAAADEAAANR